MGTELQLEKKTLFKCLPRTPPKPRFCVCEAEGGCQHELWVLGCRVEDHLISDSHHIRWQSSGSGSLCDSPQAATVPALYLHWSAWPCSFQFALLLVLWVLLYSLALCSEGGEVCGEVRLGEKGTLLLRSEVRKPPISLLWDWCSWNVAVPLEVSLFGSKKLQIICSISEKCTFQVEGWAPHASFHFFQGVLWALLMTDKKNLPKNSDSDSSVPQALAQMLGWRRKWKPECKWQSCLNTCTSQDDFGYFCGLIYSKW